MIGLRGSPFLLQSTLLFFGAFYLLAQGTIFATKAASECTFQQNGFPDQTNHEHEVLCVGNAISATIFLIVSGVAMYGSVSAIIMKDVDIITSYLLLGVVAGYTSNALTQLRLNCTAGDTTGLNKFQVHSTGHFIGLHLTAFCSLAHCTFHSKLSLHMVPFMMGPFAVKLQDDTWDSYEHLCRGSSGSVAFGFLGLFGAAISAYYGTIMKIQGVFYVQRPIGFLIGLSGYELDHGIRFNLIIT